MFDRQELLQKKVLLSLFWSLCQQICSDHNSVGSIDLSKQVFEPLEVNPDFLGDIAHVGRNDCCLHKSVPCKGKHVGHEVFFRG